MRRLNLTDAERHEHVRQQRKAYRAKNKARIAAQKSASAKRCVIKIREYHRKWEAANRRRLNEINRQTRWRLKLRVIAEYGGSCRCCGESAPEFLTIDHINGDGAAERKHIRTGDKFYRHLLRIGCPTDRYRLLCFNCNCARGSFGYCPHELAVEKQTEEIAV